ncbi:MAG: PDZ domain-containing protein [Burkholderiales bacterium]|nr:PDZ domain-containing protein [Burkholderiales bacterium]
MNAVEKGGPAEKAGVQTGDIIIRFDGKDVSGSNDLPRIVAATRPGSTVSVQVWRKGAGRDLSVTVGEIPEERVAGRGEPSKGGDKPALAANRLGLVVSDLSADKKRELKVQGGVQIEEVRGTPRGDVRQGDVVLALTAKGVTTELISAEQFNKLLSQMDKGTTLTLQIRRGEANVFATIKGDASG